MRRPVRPWPRSPGSTDGQGSMERRLARGPWRLPTGSVAPASVGKTAFQLRRGRTPTLRQASAEQLRQGSVALRLAGQLRGYPAPKTREALTVGKAPLHRPIEASVPRPHLPKASAGLVAAERHPERPAGPAMARRARHQSPWALSAASVRSPPPEPEQECLSAARPHLPGLKRWSAPERRRQFQPKAFEQRSSERDRLRCGSAADQPLRRSLWPEVADSPPALVESPRQVKGLPQSAGRMTSSAKPAVRPPTEASASSARVPMSWDERPADVFRPAHRRAPGGSPATAQPSSVRPPPPHGRGQRSGSPRPLARASRCRRRGGKPAAW